MAGPCGNFTRFPILPLPQKRQQAPEAKTVLLRRFLLYTELGVLEMLRRDVRENYAIFLTEADAAAVSLRKIFSNFIDASSNKVIRRGAQPARFHKYEGKFTCLLARS